MTSTVLLPIGLLGATNNDNLHIHINLGLSLLGQGKWKEGSRSYTTGWRPWTMPTP
jgi:hypothetical protein